MLGHFTIPSPFERSVLSLLAWAVIASPAVPAAAADAESRREATLRDYDDHLAALFEHFHRHPELSFLEKETAKRLARELRKAGVEVTEGVGGTGVVGLLRNGEGPLVLVRADMDGLPIREQSGLVYASTVTQADQDAPDAGRRALYYKFAEPKTFDWVPAGCHYNDALFRADSEGRVANRAAAGADAKAY